MNHTIVNIYSNIEKFQNHNIPRHIDIAYVGKKKLEAEMEGYQETSADDPAFTPSPDAKAEQSQITIAKTLPGSVSVSAQMAAGMLLKRVPPDYPPIAKAARVSGTVVLQATISKLGTIENLKVVSGPAMLQQAALDAVKHWRYRPYLLNGEPVEVMTTINVIFTLSNAGPLDTGFPAGPAFPPHP
jgi:TonB family protein